MGGGDGFGWSFLSRREDKGRVLILGDLGVGVCDCESEEGFFLGFCDILIGLLDSVNRESSMVFVLKLAGLLYLWHTPPKPHNREEAGGWLKSTFL